MEESQSSTNPGLDRSAQTGETLRKLREQADQTLDSHRRRLTNIESELNLHFQQITEELARDRVVDEMETEASQKLQAEFDRCREMLTQVEGDLRGLRLEAEETGTQLDQRTEELQQLREQHQQIENEKAELFGERDQLREDLARSGAELESLRAQLSGEAVDHDARLAEQMAECEQLRQQAEAGQAERDRLSNELNQLQEAFDQIQGECARLQGEHDAAGQLRDKLQSVQEELGVQQTQNSETRGSLELAEANYEKSVEQLRDAERRIQELENDSEASEQLEELQRKFDLALADVHKLKQENAELHEELARRPESDEQESPELVSLRAERDALAIRVEELVNAPPAEVVADNQQEVSDLQRRFEMAVEDVRQLKQDNATLQEKLERTAEASPAVVDDGAPLDWQAQKALLLAELEAEDSDSMAPERREARTTIEGTISITDRVVAEKDKEIQQLQELLESRPTAEPIAETQSEPHAQLYDQDELIQAERTRLEEARKEMEEKLREAEIEISVKRAKLAREQAALEEKLALVPEEEVAAEEEANPGKPRRHWLSALGLKEDE